MVEQQELKCLIAAGGTAGHVLPSLAVAEALVARGVKVTFAGSPDRVEARLVPEAGFELDTFRVSGLPRRPGPAQARALALAMHAPRACRRILRERKPDVVLGGGRLRRGADGLRRVPDGDPGGADGGGRAPRAREPARCAVCPARVSLVSDRGPRRAEVPGHRPSDPGPEPSVLARRGPRRIRPASRARVLLVFGGSQGAASLNELVVEAFGETGPAILHLCGERDYERLRGRVTRDDYKLLPFTDDFGAALAAADLVVARSGGSVWEVAAAGKPAILIPYPFATADHQAKNALFFERAGGAITIPETELGRVPDLARSLLGDADRLKEMGEAMKRVGPA